MIEKYIYLCVPFTALILCQIIKFIIESMCSKKWRFDRLFNGSGGMPSSHSAFTFSLTFSIMFLQGFDSVLFAVSLVFSIITAYDAMGVRWESGKQAEAINKMYTKIDGKSSKLREQLGHKPLEVLVGIIFAFLISLIFYINI